MYTGTPGAPSAPAPSPSRPRPPCHRYEPREVARSRTEAGILSRDVGIPRGKNQLWVSDFAVASAAVKRSTRNEPLFQRWLRAFERNRGYRLRIEGFTDCADEEGGNARLRDARAQAVFRLLGPSARSRVVRTGGAPVHLYLARNDTPSGRATNRGVMIAWVLQRSFRFEPEEITGKRLTVEDVVRRGQKLLRDPAVQRRLGAGRLRSLECLFQKLLRSDVDDRFVTAQQVLSYWNVGKPTFQPHTFANVRRELMVFDAFGPSASDDTFLTHLLSLDERITSPRQLIRRLIDQQGSAVSHGIEALRKWWHGQERKDNSVLQCYRHR